MDQFDRTQREGVIVRWHVDQHDFGICALDPAQYGIVGRYRITGACVHSPGYAGSVHQNLQHGSLLAILSDDYN